MNDWSDIWLSIWTLLPFTGLDADTVEFLAAPDTNPDPALDMRRTNWLI